MMPPAQASPVNEKIYGSLESSRQEIRLIKIELGRNEDTISCSLAAASLQAPPKFAVLSYVWGDPGRTKRIFVNGESFQVTANLWSALWHLRSFGTKHYTSIDDGLPLWADAICINQRDIEERNQQVSIMKSIYTSAACVISWLGPSDDRRLHLGLALIKDVNHSFKNGGGGERVRQHGLVGHFLQYEYEDGKQIRAQDAPSPRWIAFGELIKDVYWTRLWIFQEVILPDTDPVLVYGLATATCEQLNVNLAILKMLSPSDLDLLSVPTSLRHALSSAHPLIWSLHLRGSLLREPSMVYFLSRRCGKPSEPRDYVYALLGLIPMDIKVDYAKSVKEVYTDWFRYLLKGETEGCLQSLEDAGLATQSQEAFNLPSWVPDLARPGKQLPRAVFGARLVNSDTVEYGAEPEQYQPTITNSGFLSLYGVVLDEIDRLVAHTPLGENGDLAWEQVLLFLSVEFVCAAQNSGDSMHAQRLPLQAFFRNLMVSSQIRIGEDEQCFYHGFLMTCKIEGQHGLECQRKLQVSSPESLRRLLVDSLYPAQDYQQYQQWVEFFQPFMASETASSIGESFRLAILQSQGQVYFQTTMGRTGMGPRGSKTGDKICAVGFGCTFPLLLRSAPDDTWVYMGTSSVPGLTFDYDKEVLENEEVSPQNFLIR